MKLCLTFCIALLFCAAPSVSFAQDKAAKSARAEADKSETADKAAAKAKADKTDKAAKADQSKKPKALKGTVVKVAGNKLVLATGSKKEPKEVTIAAGADTKVMIEGKESVLADLKEGQQVSVTPAEGTPQTITVAAPKPKKDAADKTAKPADKAKPDKADKPDKTAKADKDSPK
jgi:hypothetical protein